MSKKTLNEILNKPSDMGYNDKSNDCSLLTKQEEEAMMRESGSLDPGRIKHRKDGLKMYVNSITDEIMGRNVSFRELVTDKKGRLDIKKADGFISDLIASHPESADFSEDKKEFLRLFLKCTIVGPSVDSWFDIYVSSTHVDITGTFKQLIDAAKSEDLYAKSPKSLGYYEESDRLYSEYAYSYFWFMNVGQNRLYDGIDVRETYTPEELEGANEAYEDIVGCPYGEKPSALDLYIRDEDLVNLAMDENTKVTIAGTDIEVNLKKMPAEEPEDDQVFDDEGRLLGEEIGDEIIECDPPDFDAWDADKQGVLDECIASENKYKEYIPSDHTLMEDVKSLKELLFKVEHKDLVKVVTEMVDEYLVSHELSPLCMGREYGLVSHSLDESLDLIRRSIDKARKNS